ENSTGNGLVYLLKSLAKYSATGRNLNAPKLFECREVVLLDIDEPSKYKKKGIIWTIDGGVSQPDNSNQPPSDILDPEVGYLSPMIKEQLLML
ncbi:MAG: hypothetical protein LBI45_06665, partial [Bacteroidales bacterium]|nr:hypothetical protein [Bacteroidales bacterium]